MIVLIPMLLGIIALAYTIAANLLRAWANHRVKLMLLEQMQADPSRAEDLAALQKLVGDKGNAATGRLVDHVVVGVTLAALGTLSALAAWCFGSQGWLAGAYIGGVISVAVGLILTSLGLLTRYLSRLSIDLGQE